MSRVCAEVDVCRIITICMEYEACSLLFVLLEELLLTKRCLQCLVFLCWRLRLRQEAEVVEGDSLICCALVYYFGCQTVMCQCYHRLFLQVANLEIKVFLLAEDVFLLGGVVTNCLASCW